MRIWLVSFLTVALSTAAFDHAGAADADPIRKAIDKGVNYLKGTHQQGPNYHGGGNGMGSATLAGLAMLEAGVVDTDPSLAAITKYVRANALGMTATYETSLTIMFLDRLGKEADEPIIQLLGVRLLGGQTGGGGWTYDCGYSLTVEDENKLKAVFGGQAKLVAAQPAKKDGTPMVVDRPDFPTIPVKKEESTSKPIIKEKPAKVNIHPAVFQWAKLNNIHDGMNANQGHGGDNSNTQFAILGLWCARKHGVVCDKAFAQLDQRFRGRPNDDGGWGYFVGSGSTASMTCAGLIGLAIATGARRAPFKTSSTRELSGSKGLSRLKMPSSRTG